MLLYAFLLCQAAGSKEELDNWVEKVLSQASRYEELGENWTPPEEPDWQGKGKQNAPIYQYMKNAYSPKDMSKDWYSNIGSAIQACKLDGSIDGLQHSERVQNYLKPVLKKDWQGPKHKGHTKSRWRSAIFGVAKLIDRHRAHLHACLKPTNRARQMPSNYHQIQALMKEVKNAKALEQKAKEKMAEALEARDKAVNGWNKAKRRVLEKRTAVSAARAEERAAAAEKVKAAKSSAKRKFDERLEEAVERKIAKQIADVQEQLDEKTRQLKYARERARAKESDAALSNRRLQRLKALQVQVRDLKDQLEEIHDLDSASDDEECDSPKTVKASRRDAQGRFEEEPWQRRALTYGQLARRVSPAAINANISDAWAAAAPSDPPPPMPCERELQRRRGEVTVAGECMAAFRVALSKRIISFGFDESTKFGLGLLSTNTQIETPEGQIVDVVLRGATLTAGATAEKISKEIETKLFAHGRKLLEGWKAEHERRFGAGSWAAAGGPDSSQIGLHRLAEQTLIMSDTCNAARATKRLLVEMAEAAARNEIGEDEWSVLSDADREQRVKAWQGDCDQHMRNIIINAMANGATEHLQVELEDDLAEFSSFDRMSVDCMDLIRAIFKELHAGGEYAKGKGKEFWAWVEKNCPSELVMAFERANGSRQDLALDGAVPIFANRKIVLEFLRGLRVPGASNRLENFLWRLLSSNEITALLRVCTLYSLILSQPMRWLAGRGSKLNDWSVDSAARVLNLTEAALEAIAADGHVLLDPDFDPFATIAAEQPMFRAWRTEQAQRIVKAADGTQYRAHERILAEARSPTGAGNAQATEKVVALAEKMANAGLTAMRDKRRSIADKLTSQDGANAPGKRARVHEATKGAHTGNDRCESNFGSHDVNVRTFRNATTENMSGLTQQMRMHDFDRPPNVAHDRRKRKASGSDGEANTGGFFWTGLTDKLRESLVGYARLSAPGARAAGRDALKEQDAEKLARREERVITLLNAAVEHYAHAKELFAAWQAGRAKDRDEVAAVLNGKPEAQQLEYLRKQIEMRVLGCGWTQYETRWSSNKDARIGTVAHLRGLLEEIIIDEKARARFSPGSEKGLPTMAAPPHHAARDTLTLGTMDADALEVSKRALFSPEELEAKAEAEMRRRLESGISDSVEDLNAGVNGGSAPTFDQNLVGKWIEVRWKYFDKENNEPVYIWSTGKVVRVADGLTDKKSPRARKVLPAGMVLWAWEADPEFDEAAGEQWLALLPSKWNQQQWYGGDMIRASLALRGLPTSAHLAAGAPRRRASHETGKYRNIFIHFSSCGSDQNKVSIASCFLSIVENIPCVVALFV